MKLMIRLKYRLNNGVGVRRKSKFKVIKILGTLVIVGVVGITTMKFINKPDVNLGDLTDVQYDYLANPNYEISSDNKDDMINFFDNYDKLKPEIQASWISLSQIKVDKLGMHKELNPSFIERQKLAIKGQDGKETIKEVEEHIYQIENACKAIELIDNKFDVMHDQYPNTWHVQSMEYYNEIINTNMRQLKEMTLSSYFDAFKIELQKAYNLNQDRAEQFQKGFYDNDSAYKFNGIGLCDDLRTTLENATQLYV